MRTAVVLGTRPEIIKMSPVIRALEASKSDFFVVHTGQHYSYDLDRVFFEELGLKAPLRNLGAGSGSHAEETAKMLVGLEAALVEGGASGVLVEGDTNSVLAGALAASKMGLQVGHVEAGLRSRDRRMPEELNRVVTDHVSDILFAPTTVARDNLLAEGVERARVKVTGNTVVDAVKQNVELAERSPRVKALDGVGGGFILATIHRQENVDDKKVLSRIIAGVEMVSKKTGFVVIFPAHPRTRKAMLRFGVSPDPLLVRVADPVGYLAFLKLEREAEAVLTDSGGVQEETCVLGTPCVTLRDNTERPETVEVGANVVAGTTPVGIVKSAERMLAGKRKWRNPFGDGRAGEKIVREWRRRVE
ncbi:MAG: UDP-N-acetylglucosamine 2-epimerase (non-hydrolyzing) [Nitrososphaerota archaeon]|nr:UDP-N-acetylglucosamine 2-epimerase (non-hydrolyzing) [Nitrososphaerota archaeon]